MNIPDKFTLSYGCLSKPISEQLKDQGFKGLPQKDLDYFDRLLEALNCIKFHKITTPAEHKKINDRIHKYITIKIQELVMDKKND